MNRINFIILVLFMMGCFNYNCIFAQGLTIEYNGKTYLHPASSTQGIVIDKKHVFVKNDSCVSNYFKNKITKISFYAENSSFNKVYTDNIRATSVRLLASLSNKNSGQIGFQISMKEDMDPQITQEFISPSSSYVDISNLEHSTKYYYRAFVMYANTRIYSNVCSFTTNSICSKTKKEYVDLGLPSGTMWAAYNIGATTPTAVGTRYQWGQTNYSTYSGTASTLPSSYDTAHSIWGGNWVVPTASDVDELIRYCDFEAFYKDGKYYVKVVGRNGNYIILIKAGFYNSGAVRYEETGYYWTSANYSSSQSYCMQIDYDTPHRYAHNRYSGLLVRPVMHK